MLSSSFAIKYNQTFKLRQGISRVNQLSLPLLSKIIRFKIPFQVKKGRQVHVHWDNFYHVDEYLS